MALPAGKTSEGEGEHMSRGNRPARRGESWQAGVRALPHRDQSSPLPILQIQLSE